MVGVSVAAVEQLVALRRLVVRSVAVSEAVYHHQIEDVVRPKRLGPPRRPGDQLPAFPDGPASRCDLDRTRTRLGPAGDRHFEEERSSVCAPARPARSESARARPLPRPYRGPIPRRGASIADPRARSTTRADRSVPPTDPRRLRWERPRGGKVRPGSRRFVIS